MPRAEREPQSSDTRRPDPDVEASSPDEYDPPRNGSGYPWDAVVDQPMPVPGYNWVGWSKQAANRCAWVPAGLFEGVAAGNPQHAGHFCSFNTPEGNIIQITWGSSYGPFLFDPLAFVEPAEIAGLEARVYDLAANQKVYPGSCSVQVNTRSLSSLSVLHWNAQKRPLDKAKSCAAAKQATELITKRMVPLAGGTIWGTTPQKPDPALVGTKACEVVNDIVTTFAGIEIDDENHKAGTDEFGTTCGAERKERHSTTLLTAGPNQGLAQVPPLSGAKVVDIPIGPLPARKEILSKSCAVSTEFVPGRLLRIEYSNDREPGGSCLVAQELIMVAVGRMIEKVG